MNKLKAIFQILLAVGFAALLILGWNLLAEYYVVFKFLPNGPHLDARLVIGLGAIGFLISGISELRNTFRKATPSVEVQS